jgi:hypothetical protein
MRAGVLMAVLLLTACAGASPSSSSDPVRILATDLTLIAEPFSVAVIDNSGDYLAGWAQTDRSSAPPDVDWATEVVIYLGMAGSSSCPETFQHLVVDHEAAHVFGEWDTSNFRGRPCTADLAGQGIVLAVRRDALPNGQFTLTLRETLMCPDCPNHPDQAVATLR